MLRGFLVRLTALDGQLEDNRGEHKRLFPETKGAEDVQAS